MRRRWGQFILTGIAVVGFIAIFMPPLLGVIVQKGIYRLIAVSGLPIEVVKYNRGWFTSTASIRWRVPEKKFQIVLESVGFSEQVPEALDLMIKGRIWHGPFLYHNLLHPSQWIGVAAIQRKIFFPAEQKKVFSLLGLDNAILKSDYTYVSFLGNLSDRFEWENYVAASPVGTSLRFSTFKGDIVFNPFSLRIKGGLEIENLALSDNAFVVYFPVASTSFNFKKGKSGLWVGTKTLVLPEIIGRDVKTKLFEIKDVYSAVSTTERKGLWDAKTSFSVKKIEWKEVSYGPAVFHLEANNLSAEAIANVFSIYHDILKTGEMYEGQLRQKMAVQLAAAFLPGATFQVNTFEVAAPQGELTASLSVKWPGQHSSAPEKMADLIQSSDLKGNLRMSKAMVNELIRVIAGWNYAYQIPPVKRDKLIDLQNSIRVGTDQNAYLIFALMQGNAISRDDGLLLLMLIRDGVSSEDYKDQIQELFLAKKIAPDTSYFLVWQYASLYSLAEAFNQQIKHYQQSAQEEMESTLQEFIKQGWVRAESDQYVTSIVREKEVFKLNNREYK